MLLQWRNFWPFLISSGIQNAPMSTWPPLPGHQPPVSAVLGLSHSLWRGQAGDAATAMQQMARSPGPACRKPCEFHEAEAREAPLEWLGIQVPMDSSLDIGNQSGGKWRTMKMKGPVAQITSHEHHQWDSSLQPAPLFGNKVVRTVKVVKVYHQSSLAFFSL